MIVDFKNSFDIVSTVNLIYPFKVNLLAFDNKLQRTYINLFLSPKMYIPYRGLSGPL